MQEFIFEYFNYLLLLPIMVLIIGFAFGVLNEYRKEYPMTDRVSLATAQALHNLGVETHRHGLSLFPTYAEALWGLMKHPKAMERRIEIGYPYYTLQVFWDDGLEQTFPDLPSAVDFIATLLTKE